MYAECCHIMPTGRKCQSPALRDKHFCYYHYRLHNLGRASKAAKDDPIKLPAPEDSKAIQLALAQVFNELGAKRLDPRRAGLFLYGLQVAAQIASQQSRRKPRPHEDEDRDDLVQTLELSPEGDELGPLLFVCDGVKNCKDCPERDSCQDAKGLKPEPDEDGKAPAGSAPRPQNELSGESQADAPVPKAPQNSNAAKPETGVQDAA